MEFSITKLAAWSPTRQCSGDWIEWAHSTVADNDPTLIDDKVKKPKTQAIPAMTRRRLTLWGAMATEVACQCIDEIDENTPTIFASRHGDTHRTSELLRSVAKGEALSPTAFSLSVHNSSSGIFSIERKLFVNALALAAGKETLGHALLEAQNLLNQDHEKVLVVLSDQPLADVYHPYTDEIEQPHAMAMVLTKRKDTDALVVCHSPAPKPMHEQVSDQLSMTLQFLKYWYTSSPELTYTGRRLKWRFTR